ncbi:MAG: hypothetical protein AcusKO_19600 [Acuticoccus sp.]
MTPTRVRRLARIARAQRAIAERAARAHAGAVAAHARSEADAGAIVASLNTESPLHGLLTGMMAGALMRNAVETHRLSRDMAAADTLLRRETSRADALESRAEGARRTLGKTASRHALEELVMLAAGARKGRRDG